MVLGGAQTVDTELRGNSSAFVSLSLSLFLFFLFFLYCAIFLSLLRLLTASLDSIRLFVEANDTTHEEESTNSDRNDRTEVTDLGLFFHRRFSFFLFLSSLFLFWFEETAVTTRFDEFALRLVITS